MLHEIVHEFSVRQSDAAEPLKVLGIRFSLPGPPVGGKVVQVRPPFHTPNTPSYMRVDCSMNPDACGAFGEWLRCHAIPTNPNAPFAHQSVVCGKRIEQLIAAGADETL